MSAKPNIDSRDAEIADLRVRLAEREAELAAQAQRTARVVAEAQEKLYWLERWHVDLDVLMRKPGALRALVALKGVRTFVRRVRKLKRRLQGR